MKFFIDDGSTNIKLGWKDQKGLNLHMSPNSFKREWSVSFGDKAAHNYTMSGEHYSYDPIAPEAVITTNIAWQYSDVNVVAVHHALLQTGVEPCEIDIVVTLPLSEYYDHRKEPVTANIERKKKSLLRAVTVNGGNTFVVRSVEVMPESIPAGFKVLSKLDPLHSLLIVDLGGTTLDIAQVRGRMSGITDIKGDETIGVSLMTTAVRDALRIAGTRGSSYLADDIIIHRHDNEYLTDRINDLSRISLVKETIETSSHRLIQRVLGAINSFEGYTHVMVIGGGADIIADAVRAHCGVRPERFFITKSSQFDLVEGMTDIG